MFDGDYRRWRRRSWTAQRFPSSLEQSLPLLRSRCVLVRVDHVASIIVNANHPIMCLRKRRTTAATG